MEFYLDEKNLKNIKKKKVEIFEYVIKRKKTSSFDYLCNAVACFFIEILHTNILFYGQNFQIQIF